MTAIMSGGAIPEVFDYRVVLEPEGQFIGTLNEDFAIESLPGDVFQLGNTSWRILQINGGVVRVADAQGQPPSMPFWLGEAPARSDEVSAAVSTLRAQADAMLPGPDAPRSGGALDRAIAWFESDYGLSNPAAVQAAEYLAEGKRALGVIPTADTLVLERFFDEAGGMQLVLHAPLGSRINKAWGLALRKKFCQTFNFELQAAATEDGLILSLGPAHSFPLEEVFRYLHPEHGARDALPGGARLADLRDALALGDHAGAGRAADPQRNTPGAADPAHDRRGDPHLGVSRRRRLPGQHPGRPRSSRASARRPDDARLLRGGDGPAAPRGVPEAHLRGRDQRSSRATRPSPPSFATRSSTPRSIPSSTMRRWRRGRPARSTRGARRKRAAPTTSARWTRRPSSACARRPGRKPIPRTNCMTRCCSPDSFAARRRCPAGGRCSMRWWLRAAPTTPTASGWRSKGSTSSRPSSRRRVEPQIPERLRRTGRARRPRANWCAGAWTCSGP